MTETSKRVNLERDRREKSVARGARVLDLNLKQKSTILTSRDPFCDPTGPSPQQIEAFQKQLNTESIRAFSNHYKDQFGSIKHKLTYQQFKKQLCENFKKDEPAEVLIQAMFNRFKASKVDLAHDFPSGVAQSVST